MSLLRRYEILVPLLYNDGSPIPEALLAETLCRIERKVWRSLVGNTDGAWSVGARRRCLPGQSHPVFCGRAGFAGTPRVFQRLQGKIEAAFQPVGRLDNITPGGRDLILRFSPSKRSNSPPIIASRLILGSVGLQPRRRLNSTWSTQCAIRASPIKFHPASGFSSPVLPKKRLPSSGSGS